MTLITKLPKAFLVVMSGAFLCVPTVAFADNATPKQEVVYARLNTAGVVNDVYVVNVLEPAAPGQVTDYGAYSSVQNLTDSSGITQNGDAVTVDVQGDSLSYQGNATSKALPWNVAITYTLDGKRVEAADLAEQSGAVEIAIATTRNEAVNASFFDNYLLQITVTLPGDKATNIVTEDGQIALAGSDTQVTFTGMPEENSLFKLTAQVTDFAMSGISLAAVPFSMGIEALDTTELVSGFRQLGDGVGQLKTGVEGVASGAGSLATGAGQVANGVSGIAAGAGSLVGGANDIASGVQSVAAGTSGIAGGLTTYRDQLVAQSGVLRGQVVDTSGLEAAYQNALQTYVGTFAGAFAAALQSGVSSEEAAATASAATASEAGAVQAALTNLMTATGGNAGALGAANALDGAAAGVGSASDTNSLIGAATALSAGASTLAQGADSLASGASDLASGANQTASGAGQIASGATDLSSGANQLAEGTGALYTEVQAVPDKVQQKIDDMMASYDKSDFKPVSFTSPQNTGVTLVQFVLSTDPIEASEAEAEQTVEPEENIITRLLALFGI